MTYTPEQQEAMAACLRAIANDGAARVSAYSTLRCHGIMESGGTLAPWLAPPDDSVAMDHPRADGPLRLERERGWGRYRYAQDTESAARKSSLPAWACSDWHPTEEAARKQWNALCRAAK